MDIEKLNKSQIILLTLLVSFMTSIATGIVTVSLMEQAPPAITQTVNRIVERTVEKLVLGQAAAVAAPLASSQPIKTVIVKESATLAQAVDLASASVVRLYARESADSEPVFMSLGIVLDAGGRIATDAAALGDNADAFIDLPGGIQVRGFVTSRDDVAGIAYLLATSTALNGNIPTWKPITVTTVKTSLGDTAVALSGKSSTRVASGIITAFAPLSKTVLDGIIETSISHESLLPGSPVIDSNGAVIGLYTAVSSGNSNQSFVALNRIDLAPKSVKEKNIPTQ